MVKVEVKVKKSDIEDAIDNYGCGASNPLDRAVERTFPKADYVSVNSEQIAITLFGDGNNGYSDTDLYLKLPKSARLFASTLKQFLNVKGVS